MSLQTELKTNVSAKEETDAETGRVLDALDEVKCLLLNTFSLLSMS